MIQNKYKILDFIGKGNFGSVFLGENIHNSGEKVAIKLEKKNGISILKNETRVLEYLARNGCRTQIPQVFWFGLQEENHCLIMTYFVGKTIMDIHDKSVVNQWMVSALGIMEKIHSYGVIHRDLKPAHFIFVEDKQKWILIDFGFSTFYLEGFSEKQEYIIGTPNYISLNIHNGMKYKPIDDIWSLLYIYIRYLYPELFSFSSNTKDNNYPTNYPTNHILNSENQIRKEKKELWNTFDFWEKKIYNSLQILLDNTYKIPPYKLLIDIFTKPEEPKV